MKPERKPELVSQNCGGAPAKLVAKFQQNGTSVAASLFTLDYYGLCYFVLGLMLFMEGRSYRYFDVRRPSFWQEVASSFSVTLIQINNAFCGFTLNRSVDVASGEPYNALATIVDLGTSRVHSTSETWRAP